MRAKNYILNFIFITMNLIGYSQINISTTGGAIIQDFASLGTNAIAALPANWRIDKQSQPRTLGTYTAALTRTEYVAGNNMASNASPGIYNMGAGDANTATDRALGFLGHNGGSTRSVNSYMYLRNTGTSEINLMDVNYNVEKYRNGQNSKGNTIQLFYSYNGSTWIDAGENFYTEFPGDNNNNGFASAPSVTVLVTGRLVVNIPAGADFYLCWNYSIPVSSNTNNSQAFAIDDVNISNIRNCSATGNWRYRSKLSGNWKTTSTWDISEDGTNWMPAYFAPTSNSNVTISNSHTISIDTTANAEGILVGGTLQTTGAEIIINGDLSINGSITGQNGTKLIFMGNGNQTITGTGLCQIDSLVVDKTTGAITLQRPVTVQRLLQLKGKIISSSMNPLTIGANGVIVTDNSIPSYVEGPLKKIGNTNFTFPVGKAGTIRYIGISGLTSLSEFTAEYFPADPNSLFNVGQKDYILDSINRCEYWMLDRTAGTASARVTLSYTNNCGTINPVLLVVSKWDGTQWTDQGAQGITGDTDSGTITSSNLISSFSPYAIGTIKSAYAMPVSLVHFSGVEKAKKVQLKWVTASELNNDYFSIERSSDGRSFETIGKVAGAGTSLTNLSYTFTDENPTSGTNYYRLTQFDYDGTSESSQTIAVKVAGGSEYYAKAIANMEGLTLLVNTKEFSTITIMHYSGQVITQKEINGADFEQKILVPSESLATGIYVLNITDGENKYSEKFFFNRR
jgi:hypothetical protein